MTAKKRAAIPHLKDCIAYVESCGYKYSHRSIVGSYVFHSTKPRSTNNEIAFTLPEIRDAKKHGF